MNIIYCRTGKGSKDNGERQKKICSDFLKSKDIKPDEIFIDYGFSGIDNERPSLKTILSKLDSIESITVQSVDRLFRDSTKLLDLYNILKKKGIKLFDATLGIDIIGTYDDRMIDIVRSLTD